MSVSKMDDVKLRLRLLGAPEATLDGQPLTDLKIRKTQAILYFLAATGRPQRRTVLVGLFWGDLPESLAATNLRKSLSQLRSRLGPFLEIDRTTVALKLGPDIGVDVAEFASRVENPRAQDSRQLEAAIGLYRGDFLEGFYVRDAPDFEQWVEIERGRLRELAMGAHMTLAGRYAGRGDVGQAIGALRRVVALEPWREEAHRELMLLLARDGQRGAALAQYEACRQALRKELDAELSPETQQVYESIRAGQVAAAPRPSAPSGPDAARHNLPAQLTTFVGREAESAALTARLGAPGRRLVTVVGPGGMGKTRLAVRAGLELLASQRFPDGAWFTDLSGLADATLVPQAVAGALGLRAQPERPLTETIAAYLERRELLLILDNCEHLLDGVARLVEACLWAAPGLCILTTSREPLGIAGEVTLPVPPLPLPLHGAAHLAGFDSLAQVDAVRLFVDRAGAVRPGFAVTQVNASAVAQICVRLDGMPLAIELAAARIRALTPEQIAARLDDRFRLLTTGGRTAAPRQQTLEAAIDWSYRLLSEKEQVLFRRLSIFAGGWTLEAVEAVGSGDGIEPDEVLDLLARLVDKSLVVAYETGPGPRYRMLETILAFARARLAGSGEGERVARAHLAYYRGLAEDTAAVLEGWWHQEWLERLEAEHDNLRRALGWGLEQAPEDALRATAALWFLWWLRGYFVEGRRWTERALAVADRIGLAGRTLSELLTAAATFAEHQGEPDATVAYARRGLAVAEAIGDVRNTGRLLGRLGDAASQRNQFAETDALYQRVLDLGRQAGDDWLRAGGSHSWGLSQLRRGRLDQARLLFEEALRIIQAKGNESFSLHPAANLAEIALLQGERARALQLIRDGLALARRLGDRHKAAWLLDSRGELHRLDGELELALDSFREALELARELDAKDTIQNTLDGIARVYATQAKVPEAAWLLGAAEALRDRLQVALAPIYVPWHEEAVALVRARLGDERLAAEWARGRAMPLEDAIALAMGGRLAVFA